MLYADDSALFSIHSEPASAFLDVQITYDTASPYFFCNRLTLNLNKKQQNTFCVISVNVLGHENVTSPVKLLSFNVDSQLT